MRQVDDSLAAHLSLPVTNLTTCWRITPADGQTIGFTVHDENLIIDGVTYVSSGLSETRATNTTTMEVDNIEVHGLISSNDAAAAQLFSKAYDGAQVDVFQVDFTNPPTSITPSSVLWVRTGVLGDVDLSRGKWVIEVRGLLDYLTQSIGLKTSRLCRADFGDSNCRADLGQYRKTGTVTAYSGKSITVDVLGLQTGDLANGKLEFTNKGVAFDIENNSGTRLTLTEVIEFNPVGEAIRVTYGCNKWLDDCSKYNNVVNFYGEPYVPDVDDWAAGYFNTVSL